VKRIRERNPMLAQRTLARLITTSMLVDLEDFDDCCRIKSGFATTYNRIRRVDGSIGVLAVAHAL
jgi:hypothetical protein